MEKARFQYLLGQHFETQGLIYLLISWLMEETGHSVMCFLVSLYALYTLVWSLRLQFRGREARLEAMDR